MTLAGGIVAALVSALAYGTFAVPIKDAQVVEARVHPLIFQSYKSLMCFATSWLVLLYSPFGFTWWATLAAFIWVMDGIMAIISIHLAGLGVAQTTWSVISLFVSFAWGKLLFNEPMKNLPLSLTGLALMVLGMLGLGYVASQAKSEISAASGAQQVVTVTTDYTAVDPKDRELDALQAEARLEERISLRSGLRSDETALEEEADRTEQFSRSHDGQRGEELLHGVDNEMAGGKQGKEEVATAAERWLDRHRFSMGVLGAAYVGVCAGTMMVCLKLAPPDCKGDQYTVSFGIGVGLVTSAALLLYYGGCALLQRSAPSFHVRIASGPACLAGILWSLGNYFSILAVASLGMAVGWPLVQCSLIVSNCWALFWYKEVEGRRAIVSFLASSCIILCGVVLLAYFGL